MSTPINSFETNKERQLTLAHSFSGYYYYFRYYYFGTGLPGLR